MSTASVLQPLRESLDFKIFQAKLLLNGRDTWSPQKWAALFILHLRENGGLETREGQRLFKICKQVLEESRTGNPFKDWYGAVFKEPRTSKEQREIDEYKRKMDAEWEQLHGGLHDADT